MVGAREPRMDAFTEASSEWLTLIHASCLTVANGGGVINATTVSRRFTGLSAAERARLLATARLVAKEHGLAAETEDGGQIITVRFSRIEAEVDRADEGTTGLGAIGRLLGALRPSAGQAQQRRLSR